MARKLTCNNCHSLHQAGDPCDCIKYKMFETKSSHKIALTLYRIGISDGECGQAYFKSEDDLLKIIEQLEAK